MRWWIRRSVCENNRHYAATVFLHYHAVPTHAIANTTTFNHIPTHCKLARLKKAMHILYATDCDVDSSTYVSLLHACVKRKALAEGKLVHSHITENRFMADTLLHNTLLNMYVKCGSLADARKVFEQIPQPNVCSWTMMIAAYARYGPAEEALALFYHMQRCGFQPNHFTFSSVLSACAHLTSLEHGVEIHQQIIRTGYQSHISVANALVDMYVKCGNLEIARDVFDKIPKPDVVSWTIIIAGYSHSGHVNDALKLFKKMPHRDVVSWNAMIAGFAQNGFMDDAVKVFNEMPQRDVVSWNAMIAGYAQNGLLDEALKLFMEMPQPNEVSWNTMIAGFAQNGFLDKAMKLFNEIPQRSVVSWNAIIGGLVHHGNIDEAVKLFEEMPQRTMLSWNTMISGYAHNGLVDDALKLFEKMPQRDVASWTAVVAGFAQNGRGEESLKLFQQMQLVGVKPDSKTFTSILPACANVAALEQGKEVHEKIIRSGFHTNILVVNALIDMYAKCGNIQRAHTLFNKMHQQDIVSWTTMIAGYAMHGFAKEALTLFEQMKHTGVVPDHVTLLCVLAACSHAGLVNEGYHYFHGMNEYHITPTMDHYNCMVDLLGRAGYLDEAKDFIKKMPIAPDATVWNSLLSACRTYNNVELGEYVAKRVFELDPKDATPYVLLSNIYAAAGMWGDIEKVRKLMNNRDLKKTPGCSWIEVNNQVHAFLIEDRSSP